jgi:hypothetical protein
MTPERFIDLPIELRVRAMQEREGPGIITVSSRQVEAAAAAWSGAADHAEARPLDDAAWIEAHRLFRAYQEAKRHAS